MYINWSLWVVLSTLSETSGFSFITQSKELPMDITKRVSHGPLKNNSLVAKKDGDETTKL